MAIIKNKNFEIIDVHTHIIEYIRGVGYRGELRPIGNGRARWATGEEIVLLAEGLGDKSFTYETLVKLLDTHGVSKAILLQGSFHGYNNGYVYEAQEKYPQQLFGMGTFDPYAGEYLQIMHNVIKNYKFRGLKFEISHDFGLMGIHPHFKLDGDLMGPVWEFAQEEKLVISLDLGTFHEPSFQIGALAGIARNYPGITFVVEHLFYPHLKHYEEFKKALDVLVKFNNIFYTVASIPSSTLPEKYPFPSACRYLEIAKDMAGAGKLMWGSDVPSVLVDLSYSDLLGYIAESGIFNDQELEKIYSKNAMEVYKLG